MKLYAHPLSGHSHRARLFASLIGVPLSTVDVDLASGAHKKADFLALNAFGQLPVLDDDGTIVPDSNAILVYLAKKHGRTDWLPEDPKGAAAVHRWLSVAAGELAFGPAVARLVTVFGMKYDADAAIARSHQLLRTLETWLTSRSWFVGHAPTIADVALYSYLAHAPEGNVALTKYPNVVAFLRRVEALPGFVPMPATSVGLAV